MDLILKPILEDLRKLVSAIMTLTCFEYIYVPNSLNHYFLFKRRRVKNLSLRDKRSYTLETCVLYQLTI